MITFENKSNKVKIKDLNDENVKELFVVPNLTLDPQEFATFETNIKVNCLENEMVLISKVNYDNESLKLMNMECVNDGEMININLFNHSNEILTIPANYHLANLILCQTAQDHEIIENCQPMYIDNSLNNIVYDNNGIIIQENESKVIDNIEYQESNDGKKSIIINLL